MAHQRSSMIGFLIFNFKRCPKIRSSSPIFLSETTSNENERFLRDSRSGFENINICAWAWFSMSIACLTSINRFKDRKLIHIHLKYFVLNKMWFYAFYENQRLGKWVRYLLFNSEPVKVFFYGSVAIYAKLPNNSLMINKIFHY